jgi:hypothetical protein
LACAFRQIGIAALQLARTGLGQPHRATPQIALDHGDLNQPLAFQRAQVARQRRLFEA